MQNNYHNESLGGMLHGGLLIVSNFFWIVVHMLITCYITLVIYLIYPYPEDGTTCLLCFFIDWHLIALLTIPLMRLTKKLLQEPLFLFMTIILCLLLIILLGKQLESLFQSALVVVKNNYTPLIFRLFR